MLLSVWAECCLHGWEQCLCLNMNEFYLGLIPEKETCGVESLEPFDVFEVSYSNLESCSLLLFQLTSHQPPHQRYTQTQTFYFDHLFNFPVSMYFRGGTRSIPHCLQRLSNQPRSAQSPNIYVDTHTVVTMYLPM